jgi:hypothetical protein
MDPKERNKIVAGLADDVTHTKFAAYHMRYEVICHPRALYQVPWVVIGEAEAVDY